MATIYLIVSLIMDLNFLLKPIQQIRLIILAITTVIRLDITRRKNDNGKKRNTKKQSGRTDFYGKMCIRDRSSTANAAKSSGKKMGSGFTSSMQSGLSKGPAIASKAVSSTKSRLRSGRSGAYSAGAYISQGFAQGMRTCLGPVSYPHLDVYKRQEHRSIKEST